MMERPPTAIIESHPGLPGKASALWINMTCLSWAHMVGACHGRVYISMILGLKPGHNLACWRMRQRPSLGNSYKLSVSYNWHHG
jgi:hypothetical protein